MKYGLFSNNQIIDLCDSNCYEGAVAIFQERYKMLDKSGNLNNAFRIVEASRIKIMEENK